MHHHSAPDPARRRTSQGGGYSTLQGHVGTRGVGSPNRRGGAPGQHGGRVRNYDGGFAPQPSVLAVIRRWYSTPHDFDWIFVHKSTRPMHGLIRGIFAGSVALYLVTSMLMLTTPNGPTGFGPRAFTLAVAVSQVLAILWLVFGPAPDRKWQFVAFLVFGDVGLAAVLVLVSPTSGLLGSFLFAITGSLCTFFLGPKILLAHLAFINAVIGYLGAAAYVQDLWPLTETFAAMLVASAATSAVPIFAQIAWSLVSEDARRSELDPLTGTANRRGLNNSLDDLWTAAHRDSCAIVVVMVDIDRFKSVNDRFGHDRGDEVIILVAERLAILFGDHGVLARTGGEEFVSVIVGESDELSALLSRVSSCLNNGSDPIPVTVSAGAAVLSPGSSAWKAGPSVITAATRTADSLMYRAKASGGNLIVTEQLRDL